jgi:hypothetical protein
MYKRWTQIRLQSELAEYYDTWRHAITQRGQPIPVLEICVSAEAHRNRLFSIKIKREKKLILLTVLNRYSKRIPFSS